MVWVPPPGHARPSCCCYLVVLVLFPTKKRCDGNGRHCRRRSMVCVTPRRSVAVDDHWTTLYPTRTLYRFLSPPRVDAHGRAGARFSDRHSLHWTPFIRFRHLADRRCGGRNPRVEVVTHFVGKGVLAALPALLLRDPLLTDGCQKQRVDRT